MTSRTGLTTRACLVPATHADSLLQAHWMAPATLCRRSSHLVQQAVRCSAAIPDARDAVQGTGQPVHALDPNLTTTYSMRIRRM